MKKWALACAMFGACGWTMMEPVDVIGVSEELPIQDRSSFSGSLANESFKLGSYRVADVDRKWNSTQSSSFFGFDSARMKGGFSFNLESCDGKLKGECATEERTKGQSLGKGAELSNTDVRLGCRCSDGAGAVTLTMQASTSEQYEGEVTSPDLSYKVTALTQRNKGPSSRDPLGYRVDSDSAPIGAVGVTRPGKVWLSKTLEARPRAEMACVFAGLLLYVPSKER